MGEIAFLIVIITCGIIMFGMSFGFQESAIDNSGGPALFPRIVIAFLIISAIVRIITILRNSDERKKDFCFLEIFKGSRLFFVLLFLIYILLIKPLGFVITTIIFANVLLTYLYKKQYGEYATVKKNIITYVITIVIVVAVYYLFTQYLHVLLPAGILKV